jgi:hypothetical protein
MTETRQKKIRKKNERDVRAWLATPQGLQKVEESIREGTRMSQQYSASCSISAQTLKEPFTL